MSRTGTGARDFMLEEPRDGVLWVRLTRPHRRNALTTSAIRALTDIFRGVAGRADTIGAVVLTGSEGSFCAGADLSGDGVVDFSEVGPGADLVREIRGLPQAVVAAVDGPAVGMGFSLALACDLVLVSDRAYFSS